MVVWLAVQVFQVLYGVKLEGDAMVSVNLFGFMELFAEIAAILFVCFYLAEKYKRQHP